MDVLCLDLEGVLLPEIWQGVAKRTGIDELLQTTRDIPVYDDLMRMRLEVMREHDLRLEVVHEVVAELEPLEGAIEFIDWAKRNFQVAIVSDTFYEIALPLMKKLGSPMLLCHSMLEGAIEFIDWAKRNFQVAIVSDTFYEIALPLMKKLGSPMLLCHSMQSSDGQVTGYTLRQEDPKRQAVKGFQAMNFVVHAAGDSFNDLTMLEQADHGYFYGAPRNVIARLPHLPRANNHAELRELLLAAKNQTSEAA